MEDVTLKQRYMNAVKTHYECGGHKKAARNEEIANQHRVGLVAAGEPVPTNEECFEKGHFNGEGAS